MNSATDSRFLLEDNDDQEEEEQLFERQALLNQSQRTNENYFNSQPAQGMRKRGQQAAGAKWSGENEFYELRSTSTGNSPTKVRDLSADSTIEYTFYDIQPSDTLQSVCLRYACSANHVKRINGLMTDQEFYGLRRIKLPLGKLGLLNDILLNNQQQAPPTSVNGDFLHSNNATTTSAPGSSFRRDLHGANSPGSALSISAKNSHLTASGSYADRLSEMAKDQTKPNQHSPSYAHQQPHHSHSHSFSSIREFANHNIFTDVNQNHPTNAHYGVPHANGKTALKHQNFIKSDQPIMPDLVTDVDNVEKVFEDLDYHVELAKVAAESYDQRAAELVDRIDVISPPATDTIRHIRVSKIPQLFFCSENFGLNYGKLLVFIIVVCIIFPLIGYINQTNVDHA